MAEIEASRRAPAAKEAGGERGPRKGRRTSTLREENLRAAAETLTKLEAVLAGLYDLLRQKLPDLAPDLDAAQQAAGPQKNATTARRPRANDVTLIETRRSET